MPTGFNGNIEAARRAAMRLANLHGIKFPDLGEDGLRETSWKDLHHQRMALRHFLRDLAPKADGTKDFSMALDYITVLAQQRSDEIDSRSAYGYREPGEPMGGAEAAPRDRPQFVDLKTGRQVRALRKQDRFAAAFPDRSDRAELSIGVGDYVAGLVTGRWPSQQAEAEARAMSVGALGGGGYAVPSPLASDFIDLARAQSVVMRAGAITVPLESATLDLARLASDPSFNWTAENAQIVSADLSLERVRFTARKVAALIKVSIELFEDSPNIGAIIEQALVKAAAVELDRVALVGDGSNNAPSGIFRSITQNDTEIYALNGSFSNYDSISRIVEHIRTRNHEPNALVWHPRTAGEADRLKDLQNQPMQPPPSVRRLEAFATTSIPVNLGPGSPTDNTIAVVGKFDELLLGMRREVQIEISRVAGEAMEYAQVWIRAILRADVQLARPNAFGVVTGISPTS